MTHPPRHIDISPHVTAINLWPEAGPFDRYSVTVERTGEVIASGPLPIDWTALHGVLSAYHARVDRCGR